MIFFWSIILCTSFVLTWLIRRYAIKILLLDIPNHRSSHTKPTPKGGGIPVAITWFIGIFYLYFNCILSKNLFFAFIPGILLVIIGYIDDKTGISPAIRIIVQLFIAILGLYFLGILKINIWHHIMIIPFALFAVIWSINLFNFLDGIDGYIGSEVVFIGIACFIITGDTIGILLAVVVLGFLLWNWPKAKIFLGDAGSTLLGYIVAILAIYFYRTHQTSIIVWMILTSVFWFDASITIIRRIINREKIWVAHRKHAYQRIVQSGFSHQKTVLYSIALNMLGFCFAFLAFKNPKHELVFLLLDLISLGVVLKKIDAIKPFERDNT